MQITPNLTAKRAKFIRSMLQNYAFPHIGHRNIQNISAPEMLNYAVAAGLVNVLKRIPRVKHYASLVEREDVVQLLRAMRRYHGTPVVYYALWFSVYTFARPGEVRRAEWSEISGDTWSIPKR